MAKQSKFFRVAVEGATTDGREIDRAWIDQMAASYNPDTYTALVNIEHIRGFSGEKPFNCYGKVLAVKAEDVEIDMAGKTEKRRALFAQIEPNDQLLELNGKGQKLFTSIEVNPAFASSGKAYLQGLAVTDNPASIGTEMLAFAAGAGDKSPLAARKIAKDNLFTAAVEADLQFEEVPAGQGQSEHAGFFAAATAFFKQFTDGKPTEEEKPKQEPVQPQQPANDNDPRFAAVAQGIEALTNGLNAFTSKMEADVAKLTGEINGVKASIESTDGDPARRTPATGGDNYARAEC